MNPSISMNIDKDSGLLDIAKQTPSPNFDDRPADTNIDLIVLHNISLPPGQFGGPWIDDLFTRTLDPSADPFFGEIYTQKISSHILIRRDGEVVQYVPFHCRAWHAGKSNYQGREHCNDYSIGIELEGCDDKAFTEIQYLQLTGVIKELLKTYNTLSKDRVTGHSDIAPGRKTDPGPCFDWQQVHRLLETYKGKELI